MNRPVAGLAIALAMLAAGTPSHMAWAQVSAALPARARVIRVQPQPSNALFVEEVAAEGLFGEPSEPAEATAAPAAESESTSAEDAQKKAKEAQEKQQRLKKIKKLQFDRRPSTVLLVWKQFELEKSKEAQEAQEAAAKEAEEAKAEETKSAETTPAEANDESEEPTASKAPATEEKPAAKQAGEAPSAESASAAETKSDAENSSEEVKAEASQSKASDDTEQSEEAANAAKDATEEGEEQAAEATKTDADDKTATEEKSQQASKEEPAKEVSAEEPSDEEKTQDAKEGKPEATEKKPEEQGPNYDKQLADLRRDVTLSRWPQVKEFLESQPEDEAKIIFKQILATLAKTGSQPAMAVAPNGQNIVMPVPNQRGSQPEVNVMTADDLLAIARLAPAELEDADLSMLSRLISVYQANGYLLDDLIERFGDEVQLAEDDRPFSPSQAAELLIQSGHTLKAKDFLPTVEDAVEQQQHKELIQLSKYYYALYRQDHRIEDLEKAWQTVQEILSADEVENAQQQQALLRAVDLAPQVRETLGQQWLGQAFKDANERTIEILSTIGNQAATGLQTKMHDATKRLELLRLQSTAIEALVESSPEVADNWRDKLTLLANVWLREAQVSFQYDTSTTLRPAMQRDMYGNIFYYNSRQSVSRSSNQPEPIPVHEILKVKPSELWMKYVDEGLQPQMEKQLAQLLLKVNEEDEAFPYIERLAATHPQVADSLVSDFLRIWTDNHDPNSSRNRSSSYMYMYGYERRAESIPLTRSKQQRNLEELSALVKRLNALPLEDVDEQQLVRAFTTCHSSAEVYQLDAITKVFGPLESLEPKTLAALGQQMRTNLVGMWRLPATQNDAKTKRKQKDIAAEVERGYKVAVAVVEGGLAKHPDDWSLVLARASLLHDANDYRRTISPDSKFVDRQENAFGDFQKAAELYSSTVGDIREDQETTKPFEVWYYASMGACDPERIEQGKPKDPKQLALIREGIQSLPGAAAERHMSRFANTLFTRMSAVKPALKYHYLESGLSIVGNNEQAIEARRVFDYYSDLVTEITLESKIDGSDVVGHDKPFGVFVNLVHTREIERESGGFARYLQNQNNGNRYYYNYGRPLENYRDKFEEQVVSAVGDQFEVLSVTFQAEDVNSRSLPDYGWRYTPYAYVLMKAKGPEVDKLPAFQLDLDFLDTSGHVVLPIASSPLPLDASGTQEKPRPADHIAITQTLDERQAAEGELVLEVKASSQGLVPDLDNLLELDPSEFDVVEVEDEGLSVSRFDPDSPKNVILSERSWMVTMHAKEGLETPPVTFEFAEPKMEITEAIYQRYDDADLLAVEPVIGLEAQYASSDSSPWWWLAAAGAVLLLIVGIGIALAQSRPEVVTEDEFAVPDRITPFTVLGLLDRIESRNGIDDQRRTELRQSRADIERYYFEEEDAPEPNLEEIARSWSRQAKPSTSSNGHHRA